MVANYSSKINFMLINVSTVGLHLISLNFMA